MKFKKYPYKIQTDRTAYLRDLGLGFFISKKTNISSDATPFMWFTGIQCFTETTGTQLHSVFKQ